MEVDNLETTERGKQGFGSSNISSNQSIQTKEAKVSVYLQYAEMEANEFFRAMDISQHTGLIAEKQLLSSAMVNESLTCTMNNNIVNQMREARKTDHKWAEQRHKFVRGVQSNEKMLDDWTELNGLLYNENQMYVPENKAL